MFLPFVLPHGLAVLATPILFTVVMLSSLSAVAGEPRQLQIGTVLAVPACALIIVTSAVTLPRLTIVAETLALLFLSYVAVLILGFVLRARQVDLGIILGSVCVYLLVALMWANAYHIIERVAPGSFAFPSGGVGGGVERALTYFSFVTITTLGYGDVQPVTSLARMVSVFEAVIGQLYLVILVARLVGLHTALESRRLESRE
jgi:hypothetical protein